MIPELLKHGGAMMWLLLAAGSAGLAVFVERFLHYRREQINSIDFLNGVRTVLRRNNVVEALSICDATPGPVARLVKVAVLNRSRGRDGMREALEETGIVEVATLEDRLPFIATLAQVTPVMGLLGTVIGFMDVFHQLQVAGVAAPASLLAGGVWKALVCTGAGLTISIPCYAGYNYLVARVNKLVVEMERASTEVVNLLVEGQGAQTVTVTQAPAQPAPSTSTSPSASNKPQS